MSGKHSGFTYTPAGIIHTALAGVNFYCLWFFIKKNVDN